MTTTTARPRKKAQTAPDPVQETGRYVLAGDCECGHEPFQHSMSRHPDPGCLVMSAGGRCPCRASWTERVR